MIQLLPIVLTSISLVATGQPKFAESGLRVHCYIPITETRLGVEGETDGFTIWFRARVCRNVSDFVRERTLTLSRIQAINMLVHESSHAALSGTRYFRNEAKAECRGMRWIYRVVRKLGGSDFQARMAWKTVNDLQPPGFLPRREYCGRPRSRHIQLLTHDESFSRSRMISERHNPR